VLDKLVMETQIEFKEKTNYPNLYNFLEPYARTSDKDELQETVEEKESQVSDDGENLFEELTAKDLDKKVFTQK
jgi:hypothetical protein